jgi:hypothetical protein
MRTVTDPLRAVLCEERRLLLVVCLLLAALIASLYVNRRQAERIERLTEERTLDHETITKMQTGVGHEWYTE